VGPVESRCRCSSRSSPRFCCIEPGTVACAPCRPGASQPAGPQIPKAFAAVVGDAKAIGPGPILAYRTKDQTLVSLPTILLDRLFFWYVEAARFPEAAVAKDGNAVAEAVVTLERQGSRLMVRDRMPAFQKRSPSGVPTGDPGQVDPRRATPRSTSPSTPRRSGR